MPTIDAFAHNTQVGLTTTVALNHANNVLVIAFATSQAGDSPPVGVTASGIIMTLLASIGLSSVWYCFLVSPGTDNIIATWGMNLGHNLTAVSFINTLPISPYIDAHHADSGNGIQATSLIPISSPLRMLIQCVRVGTLNVAVPIPPQATIVAWGGTNNDNVNYLNTDAVYTLICNLGGITLWDSIGLSITDYTEDILWKRRHKFVY